MGIAAPAVAAYSTLSILQKAVVEGIITAP